MISISSAFDVISKDVLSGFVDDLEGCFDSLKEKFSVLPKRETEFSAGYDLSCITDYSIPPHTSCYVSFAQCIEIEDENVVGVISPRSSLAKKRGLLMTFGPKYIYPGEVNCVISICFTNFLDSTVELKCGDKIAQCVLIENPYSVEDGEVIPDPLDPQYMALGLNDSIELIRENRFIESVDSTIFHFQSPCDQVIRPGEVVCIMTGLRAKIDPENVFIIQQEVCNPCLMLANCIGVVDSDYYDNPSNGGEIGVLLVNTGIVAIKINFGDVIAAGSVFKYAKFDDDSFGGKRVGGFGSTGN